MVDVMIVLIIILVLVCVVLPWLYTARRRARIMQNGTQVRGIQGSYALFANGNNGYYPGFNGKDFNFIPPKGWMQGKPDGQLDAQRMALMLENSFYTGDYYISPQEVKKPWITGLVTTANYSYAALQLPFPSGTYNRISE